MHRSVVIFDLDGTLTRPYLDFDLIRSEIGVPEGPILEAMTRMDEATRERAESVLDRHEREAAYNGTMREGAEETIKGLREHGYPVAILTRNVRKWTELVLERFAIVVDALRTRDDGAIKPSAQPVLSLCAQLDADPKRSWMVGDHLFDILAGREAGTQTVLIIGHDRQPRGTLPSYADQADHLIRRLPELIPLVTECRIANSE